MRPVEHLGERRQNVRVRLPAAPIKRESPSRQTLYESDQPAATQRGGIQPVIALYVSLDRSPLVDRKSTRLNSSHVRISYAVFCLKKKTKTPQPHSSNSVTLAP